MSQCLSDQFRDLAARNEKALIVFFTAGDQQLNDLPSIIETLQEGGADAIEIGIPFSDPFGEGPTIQAGSRRALDRGVTPHLIFEAAARARASVPLLFMGYYNPVFHIGHRRFAAEAAAAGITGAIICDLSPEESDDWCAACAEFGIDPVFLVAPTSTQARIEAASMRSTGFVYVVSRTGVTGAENAVPNEVHDLVVRVKSLTRRPACVGFGVSSPEHVQMVCQVSDGAVIGSALVRALHERWAGGRGSGFIVDMVRSWKSATKMT